MKGRWKILMANRRLWGMQKGNSGTYDRKANREVIRELEDTRGAEGPGARRADES